MKNFKFLFDESDAVDFVKNLINNENEFNKVLVDEKGQKKQYSISEEDAKLFAAASPINYCPDEELIKNLIKIVVNANVEKIANWVISSNPVLKIKYKTDNIVGYRIDSPNGEKHSLNNVLLTIRKDTEYKTEYGFYISGMVPIDPTS